MPRLTRIYTRKGDDGTTGLGGGQRVLKDALRVATFGTVDELNAAVGLALAAGLASRLADVLPGIQNELMTGDAFTAWLTTANAQHQALMAKAGFLAK